MELPSYSCDHTLSRDDVSRYSRQLIVDEIGVKGQEQLRDKSVLVIGAGGLGSPVILYLAAAGVGQLGICDYDTISIDNLHRQIIHNETGIGDTKIDSAIDCVRRLNSSINVVGYREQLTNANAIDLITQYDVVADCSDNPATRYLINDACVLAKKPLVSGSALRWEGQLTIYNNGKDCPCYRCLYPIPPRPDTVTSCADGGVIGPVLGVIGSMQALEIIKLLTGLPLSFTGVLLIFDGLSGRSRSIRLRSRRSDCHICGDCPTIVELQDYEQFCGAKACDKIQTLHRLSSVDRLNVTEYATIRSDAANHNRLLPLLIDIRPRSEFAIGRLPEAINIPIDELKTIDIETTIADRRICDESNVYIVCHRGNDSQEAVMILRQKLADHNNDNNELTKTTIVRDLIGGLDAWQHCVDSTFPRY